MTIETIENRVAAAIHTLRNYRFKVKDEYTGTRVSSSLVSRAYDGVMKCKFYAADTNYFGVSLLTEYSVFLSVKFVNALDDEELLFILAGIGLRRHYELDQQAPPGVDIAAWSMAIEYCNNYMLVKEKIGRAPKCFIFDDKYTPEFGLAATYEDLIRRPRPAYVRELVSLIPIPELRKISFTPLMLKESILREQEKERTTQVDVEAQRREELATRLANVIARRHDYTAEDIERFHDMLDDFPF